MFLKMIPVMALLMLLLTCGQKQRPEVTHLQCEYKETPKGIAVKSPRFSWVMQHSGRNVTQDAYRIVAAKTRKALKNEDAVLWDSGKKTGAEAGSVSYAGKPLESSQKYFWKVKVWDGTGTSSRWSKPAAFYTGILHPEEWHAHWIGGADTSISAPLLRKAFQVKKPVKDAIVHVTGVGYYQMFLNGDTTGNQVLAPAMTDYDERVLYNTFDVTARIQKGTNVIGLVAGKGAYDMKKLKHRYNWFISNLMGQPGCLLQMHIRYTDGSTKTIITDKTWRYAPGPVTFNHFYGGEDYDARKASPEWAKASFDASDWDTVRLLHGPEGTLDAQLTAPLRVTRTLKPVAQTRPKAGTYLFDLGQNMPGWWQIRVKGTRGTTLKIRGAETLNDSLFPRPLKAGDSLSTYHDYHSQVWSNYTLAGTGMETYEPAFFYTGFRYIEVQTNTPQHIESLDVRGRVVRSALKRNGHFRTSDTLLNRIYRATRWSQKGNMHGFPTDCPQREKGGYTGDGQVIAQTIMHDFHAPAYFTKWMNDMQDAQQNNGRIPNTAPTLVGGTGGGIGWGSAYVLLPWWMYQYYDDKQILERHYASMKKYLNYLRNLARNDAMPEETHIINDFGGYWDSLGEWRAPGEKDGPNHPVVNTYYFYKDARVLAQIAEVTGHMQDAEHYRALADTIKQAFNQKFYNPETHLYGVDTVYQTYQLIALAGNLVPKADRQDVMQTLIRDITETKDGHLYTGIIGTQHLWHVLSKAGRADVAYQTVKQTTYPGYGYWLENGATTLWEVWSGEASHNHQMFGSVNSFFYQYLAGIRAPVNGKTTRAYRHIQIKPFIPEDLDSVGAAVFTAAGEVASRWHKADDKLHLQVTIPAGSTATIHVPVSDEEAVTVKADQTVVWENGRFQKRVKGIQNGKPADSSIAFSTGSGTYRLTTIHKR